MFTYSRLTINEAQDHRDPSDHVIIAHAIGILTRSPLYNDINRDGISTMKKMEVSGLYYASDAHESDCFHSILARIYYIF